MKTFLLYVIMGRDGRFLGQHGWTDDKESAELFDAEDAAFRILHTHPNTSAIAADDIGYDLTEEIEEAEVPA